MKLPSFLIIGAQKAGTTSLHAALEHHPDIFMSTPKELYFFDVDENYNRGTEWYAKFFRDWRDEKVAGESTPDYLWYKPVPERIAEILPNAKLIILLRNPVSRAYSSYWYAYCNGDETLSFEDALAAESFRATQGRSIHGISSYVERGLYSEQIKRYLNFFDRSQLLFLITEEYKKNPENTLQKATKFLGVQCNPEFLKKAKNIKKNVSRMPRSARLHKLVPPLLKSFYLAGRILRKINLRKGSYPPMHPETQLYLREKFKDSNAELEDVLGKKLEMWN